MERFFGMVPRRRAASSGPQPANPEAASKSKDTARKIPLPWDEAREQAKKLEEESKELAGKGDRTGAATALYGAAMANEAAYDLVTDPQHSMVKALLGKEAAFDYYNSAHFVEANRMSKKAQTLVNTVDHPDTYQMLAWIELNTQKYLPPEQ